MSLNEYKEKVKECMDSFSLKYKNKDVFIHTASMLFVLVENTDLSFLEMCKEIMTQQSSSISLKLFENLLFRDIIQHFFKECCKNKMISTTDNFKQRYDDNFEEVERRMFIRKELYKNGWSIQQIVDFIILITMLIDKFIYIHF